ncbi:hypothetical protein QVD17_37266 [Tagetes erecta]|uniref:Uncharacterized protein n=1 Tax=Tagetes erecta TaxID=13708 RepID=A0AAD8JXX4_TARER|nr:hypothetical protein QVD17_37266 [Tagetes erecta]
MLLCTNCLEFAVINVKHQLYFSNQKLSIMNASAITVFTFFNLRDVLKKQKGPIKIEKKKSAYCLMASILERNPGSSENPLLALFRILGRNLVSFFPGTKEW